MEEPLVIPITSETEGVDAGIDAVSKAFGELNQQLDATSAKGAKAGKATADAAKAAAPAAPAVQGLAARYQELNSRFEAFQKRSAAGAGGGALAGSLNNLMGQLAGEARELAHGADDATQSFVNMAAQALPSMGPVGAALAALAGGIGLITRAEREQQEEIAKTRQLQDAQARLGPLYTNIASSIDAAANAQERLNQTLSSARALMTAQAGLITAGFSTENVASFSRSIDAVLPALRSMNGGLQSNLQVQDVMAAVTSKNVGQFRQWGIQIEFGENAAENMARAILALNNRQIEAAAAARAAAEARVREARAGVEAARAQGNRSGAIGREVAAANTMTAAEAALTAARRAETAAVERQLGQAGQRAQSLVDEANLTRELQKQKDAGNTTARTGAEAATALERLEATRAMAEAEYDLSRAQVLSAAGGHHDRLRLENVLRVEGIRHLRDQIVLAEEDSRRGRQRNENATQALARRAQAVERVATLTRELAAAEDDEAQRAAAAREALTAQMQAAIDTADRLAATRAAAGLAAITRETEELTRASARYTAEHAGEYQSRAERVAQIDRESAARAVLVARLDEQARAAELALTTARSLAAQPAVDEGARAQALAAVQTQETALAAVRTQQHALESAQWSAQTARNDLTMSQISRLRNHFRELGDSSVNASGMVLQSFDAITGAVGENIAALAMQEATWAGAWDAMKYATVKSITEIAAKEAVMQSAAGLAALASFNFSSAGLHFAAAAAYGTIALGAGYAAAATKPPKDEAGGTSSRTPVGLGPQGSAGELGSGASVVENYYGPVIDGRASTDDQVGQRVNRYQRDGALRMERAA